MNGDHMAYALSSITRDEGLDYGGAAYPDWRPNLCMREESGVLCEQPIYCRFPMTPCSFLSMVLMLNIAVPISSLAQTDGADHQGSLQKPSRDRNMRIVIRIGGQTATAKLEDNATSRDFLSQLPMTLSFDDFHSTEKISYLPKKLSTDGAPDGFDPSVGTIAYYAPWGNLAIFYKDFRYSGSLVNLGRIESGLEILSKSPTFKATIERDGG